MNIASVNAAKSQPSQSAGSPALNAKKAEPPKRDDGATSVRLSDKAKEGSSNRAQERASESAKH